MNRITRPAVTLGAAALLSFSLTACGGGAPTDASVDAFCEVVTDDSWAEGVEEGDYEGIVEALQDHAGEIEEVGTPEDMSDDEREGWEIAVEAADDLDADAVQAAVEDGENPLEAAGDDKDKHDAYLEYRSETCSEGGSAPEEE
jgi:hypothetical protein